MAERIIRQDLTQAQLMELLIYCEATGIFRWRVSAGCVKSGAITGCPNSEGYLVVRIDRKLYRAHRLAWLYVYGVWPAHQIDHIDRDRTNNRIANLREALGSDNNRNCSKPRNNTSGYVGVHWHKARQKWQAYIDHLGKRISLGYLTNLNEALAARKAGELQYWGVQRAE